MPSIFWFLGSIAVGYIIIVLLMYVMQSNLIYHPQQNLWTTPSSAGLSYEDVNFTTDDNVKLHGWYVPADSAELTVLYFHGNAGNISGRMETIQLLHQMKLNVFIFDYRGYGKSQGSPSEEGTYQDALAAWNYLQKNKGIADSSIVIMGRSLGGSVAAWLAARKNAAAAVIESTFTSAADLGADLYPWLPVRWMITYQYNTVEYIKDIKSPLFMAHSKDDQVVPYHHGRALFKAASEPKTFIELRGSHGSGFWETGAKYRNGLQDFLENYTSYKSKVSD